MSEYIVKILDSYFVTHDVKQFIVEKPKGYTFKSGQATDVSVNLPEWKNKLRPFTFTSLNEWNNLEFTIKIYPERKGVTDVLGSTNSGSELILHDVFGAIRYKGAGVFIAGGAGITPFISIIRSLYKDDKLEGNILIYSNKTSADVILRDELYKMLRERFVNIFTRENVIGFLPRRIDREFLVQSVSDFGQHFYVCGPAEFVKDISKLLLDLGATADSLILEE